MGLAGLTINPPVRIFTPALNYLKSMHESKEPLKKLQSEDQWPQWKSWFTDYIRRHNLADWLDLTKAVSGKQRRSVVEWFKDGNGDLQPRAKEIPVAVEDANDWTTIDDDLFHILTLLLDRSLPHAIHEAVEELSISLESKTARLWAVLVANFEKQNVAALVRWNNEWKMLRDSHDIEKMGNQTGAFVERLEAYSSSLTAKNILAFQLLSEISLQPALKMWYELKYAEMPQNEVNLEPVRIIREAAEKYRREASAGNVMKSQASRIKSIAIPVKNTTEKPAQKEKNNKKNDAPKCENCGFPNHKKDECFSLRPDLRPPGYERPKSAKKWVENPAPTAAFAMAALTATKTESQIKSKIFLDSCASHHFFSNKDFFVSLSPHKGTVKYGGSNGKIAGVGTVVFATADTAGNLLSNFRVSEVYFVPDLFTNLLSVVELSKKGVYTLFEKEPAIIFEQQQVMYTDLSDGLPQILLHNRKKSALATSKVKSATISDAEATL